jgi:TatD DNase family protein
MFSDSHCHLEMEEYDDDRASVVDRACDADLSYILTVGTEERYFDKVVEIIDHNDAIYGAVGIHPHNAATYSDKTEDVLRRFLSHPKIVGCGEIGLDFFRDYAPRERQLEVFSRQIDVARAAGLPIIVHSRNARQETLEALQAAKLDGYPVVIHCYSYDLETAMSLVAMGAYLSIPGTVTYKNSGLADVVKQVPIERLLSETDAPFLTPQPKRGKRNEPAFVRLTVEEMARIRNMETDELAKALTANFVRLFLNHPGSPR